MPTSPIEIRLDGLPPLHKAILNHNLDKVSQLLSDGADVNSQDAVKYILSEI
jgi:ankyrin repeat protein